MDNTKIKEQIMALAKRMCEKIDSEGWDEVRATTKEEEAFLDLLGATRQRQENMEADIKKAWGL